MAVHIQRREFIGALGVAAAAWAVAARAQQPTMPVIGFLNSAALDTFSRGLRAFRQGLKEAGYVEGESVTIDYRWAEGELDRLPGLAGELASRRVAAIVTTGSTQSALAAKAATATIPIVFTVGDDPVRLGLVASLARPGGNATGANYFIYELGAKRLALLHELVPTAARVAVLANPANAAHAETMLRDLEAAARTISLQLQIVNASTSGEIDAAFVVLAREGIDALFVLPDPYFFIRRVQLAQLAARHAVPAIYAVRDFIEVGGLMSYGTDVADAWRQAGTYTGHILKGAKPADLPVVQASKFELIVNHQTARMLGLTVPPSLLAVADEVIE
jgi:putative ABC transport system substrate-binding protein